jgi:hypothetical protein
MSKARKAGYFSGKVPEIPLGDAGDVVKVNSGQTQLEYDAASGGGSTTFTGLTDTPANYSGAGGRVVKVNSGATALEFVADSTKRTYFASAYGNSGQVLTGDVTDVIFAVEETDINNVYNHATGEFTSPFNGILSIDGRMSHGGVSSEIRIFKNGVKYVIGFTSIQAGFEVSKFTSSFYVSSGDVITIRSASGHTMSANLNTFDTRISFIISES